VALLDGCIKVPSTVTHPLLKTLEEGAALLSMQLSPAPIRPESLCIDKPNAAMKAVDKELAGADAAEKAGDKQKAEQLRQQARTDLSRISPTAAVGLTLVLKPFGTGSDVFPPSIQAKLELGSRYGRTGDDTTAAALKEEAKSEFGKWADGELGGAIDGYWAEDIAHQASEFGMTDLANKAMDQAQKWFEKKFQDALAALPCPPEKDQVNKVLQDLSDAMYRGLISAYDQTKVGTSWQGAMAKIEAYIRASAPTVGAGRSRSDLGQAAYKFGFPTLADEIVNNKNVDPPRCPLSVRRNVNDAGFMSLTWFAYSCQGPKGPWKASLYILYTVVHPSPSWILSYTWSFSSIPGEATAQPSGVQRTAPGGASNSDAFIAYIDDPFPVTTNGKALRVNFPVKEGTMAIGRTQEFMEAIKLELDGQMLLEQKAISQCK
jgi:hypothetical protein